MLAWEGFDRVCGLLRYSAQCGSVRVAVTLSGIL